jgi:3-methyladenine DNA glycosylase AlkD
VVTETTSSSAAVGSGLAATVLDRLTEVYGAARDPDRAAAMTSYMRDRLPFLGIPAPRQRLLGRQVTEGLPRPTEDDLRAVALGCWRLPEREYQYFGVTYLRRYARTCSTGLLATVRELVTGKPWWDTVDALAANVVGPLVWRHPRLTATLDAWAVDDDLWVVRTALLYQLRYREDTDADRLFRYCSEQSRHRDFFVRKAIGWALREYAKTDPTAVRRYVAAHPQTPPPRGAPPRGAPPAACCHRCRSGRP